MCYLPPSSTTDIRRQGVVVCHVEWHIFQTQSHQSLQITHSQPPLVSVIRLGSIATRVCLPHSMHLRCCSLQSEQCFRTYIYTLLSSTVYRIRSRFSTVSQLQPRTTTILERKAQNIHHLPRQHEWSNTDLPRLRASPQWRTRLLSVLQGRADATRIQAQARDEAEATKSQARGKAGRSR